jgi:hypothetical protein
MIAVFASTKVCEQFFVLWRITKRKSDSD